MVKYLSVFLFQISFQGNGDFGGGFVLCSIPILNLECKRGQNQTLDFSENQIT